MECLTQPSCTFYGKVALRHFLYNRDKHQKDAGKLFPQLEIKIQSQIICISSIVYFDIKILKSKFYECQKI
jgi:hypothetical protein